jgi:aspartate/methionine/tyrosine aminotransferase
MPQEINSIERTYRERLSAGEEVLKLFSGNPNEHGIIFPPQVLEKAYRAYFQNQHYQPHPKGLPGARKAICRSYRTQGAEVDSENLILTSGTSESFLHLFTLLGRPGDHFLTPSPAYPLFDHIARAARVELRPYPLHEERNWALNVSELASRVDDRTRGIVLISPNNPTGAVLTGEEISEVVELANRKGIPLLCDEVFSEFYFGEGEFPRVMAAKPRLAFTLNGISKMFALPALKLGWIAVSGEKHQVEEAVDRLETQADTFLTCHTPIQEALPEIFAQGEFFLREYRATVATRRKLALEELAKITGIHAAPPRGGFYLTARVEGVQGFSEEQWVIALLRERGVFVHPGFYYDYESGIHFILSFLTREDDLRTGIRALGEFYQSSST